ncbi:unnamed protein product [Lactuca saligna]|uniref:Protein kinase domain-containing protein n=1 Tax=Lactuca saligna TaxID=75948 RepID=A0AA35V675_LACSI|nr:unnamed protein product [Lactuca saligna]
MTAVVVTRSSQTICRLHLPTNSLLTYESHLKRVSGTTNFSDANLIRESAFGKAYKGHLFRSEQQIDIVAERLDRKHGYGDVEFWKEISMLSSLKHENLVSVIGFCEEKDEKIIIYKDKVNGSLDKLLRDPTLTWMRRLQICVGVAHALSYIHYDKRRDFSVIHRDIRSSKILLNDHWEAKLSGFELSISQKAARRNRLCLIDVRRMRGYCDPTYVKSGSVTHKSDMYYFGVLLFEVLFGKNAVMVNEVNRLLDPLAISHYEGGRLDDMIDPVLWKQMDPQSFKIFSEIAYYCLKKQRSQRPNIDQIVMKLEKALESQQKHENPAYSTVEGIASKTLKGKNVEHLRIPLSDIVSATKNFSKTYFIGSGTYGDVYKAELDHFDDKYFLPLQEKQKSELPKKRSIVAVKRILVREDKQGEQGFLAEIEMLSSCSGKLANLSWMQRIKICIDIARGLHYLHTKIEDERRIIHRDIKSGNILLGENWVAKIADFGLSKFHPKSQQTNTLYTEHIAGTKVYLDPEYDNTDSNGIAPVARRRFNEGTIKEIVDPRLLEETHESVFTLNKGPDQDSLDAFSKIAYQCVAETQAGRPTAEVIIKKLEEALSFQENIKDNLKLSLEGLISITENFSSKNEIGKGGFGKVYKGEVAYADGRNTIAAKRLDKSLGYCNEMDENIIVYEYASRGSLDKHLSNNGLTWRKRLEICIDIASGLDFLHGGAVTQEILCGRLVCEIINGKLQIPTNLFKRHYEEGNLDEMVFEGIKKQAVPKSLTTFQAIAYQCLHDESKNRPTTSEVLLQLKRALEFQEDYEIWAPKLPNDYEQTFKMSNFPEIHSIEKKKDLYDMLCKGILLQEGKMLFSLGDNGERNGMISARKFLYKRRSGSHKWRSVPESRFDKVAKMLDLSNLNIQKICGKSDVREPKRAFRDATVKAMTSIFKASSFGPLIMSNMKKSRN